MLYARLASRKDPRQQILSWVFTAYANTFTYKETCPIRVVAIQILLPVYSTSLSLYEFANLVSS